MIRKLVLGAVLTAAVALCAASFGTSAKLLFAASQYPCYQGLLDRAKQNAEVLVLGSSRMLLAIDPEILAREAGLRRDRAFNLSHNERSYLVDLLLMRDVLQSHTPRLLVFEAYVPSNEVFALERDARFNRRASHLALRGGTIDRLAALYADPEQLRAVMPGGRPELDLVDRWRMFARRIDHLAALTLSGRLLAAHLRHEEDCAVEHQVCYPHRFSSPQGYDQFRQNYRRMHPQSAARPWSQWRDDEPELFIDPDQREAVATFRTVAAEGRSAGMAIYFVYLPTRFVPPPSASFVARFSSEVGAPLLVPPRSLLQRLQASGYADDNHLGVTGRRLLSEWLARELTRSKP